MRRRSWSGLVAVALLAAACTGPPSPRPSRPTDSATATAFPDTAPGQVPGAVDPMLNEINRSQFITPPTTMVVSKPTLVRDPAGTVTCLLTPAAGAAPDRVDCQLRVPATGVTQPNPGCPSWGSAVRLVSGRVRLTCSAQLGNAPVVLLPGHQAVVGSLVCGNGPNGVICQDTTHNAGFRVNGSTVTFLGADPG